MNNVNKLDQPIPVAAKELLSDGYANNDIQGKILTEQISILYKNLMISIPANFVCATVVFAGLYQTASAGSLWSWYIAVILTSLFRVALIYYFHRHPNENDLNLGLFVFGVAISAAIWGVADSMLMPDEQLVEQMIIIVIVAGITAGGIQTLYANLIASIVYVVLIVTPLCIWLFSQSGYSYFVLGIAMTTYLIFTVATAMRGYKQLYMRLRLQFENLRLAENLSQMNAQLQQVNQSLKESEATLRNTEENAPIGLAIVSLQGRWLRVNHALCDILGYGREELENLTFQDIAHPDDKEDLYLQNLLQGRLASCQYEKQFIKKNGQSVWGLINESLQRDADGKPVNRIIQIQDISIRKDYEIKMSALNERTSLMLSQLQQHEDEMNMINKMNERLQACRKTDEAYSIIYISAQDIFPDLSGGLAIFNDSTNNLETVLQWGPERLLKKEFSIDDCWALRAGHLYIVNDVNREMLCKHFDGVVSGGYVNLPLTVQSGIIGMLHLSARNGNTISKTQLQLATIFNEVIKLSIANIRLHEALQDQAIHDPLTGLYNRRYLNEIMQPILNRIIQEKGTLCVCMIDIDNFKQFNDLYGHEAGDEVLTYVGSLLRREFQGVNIACRYGGEEFLVLMPDTTIQYAVKHLDEIRKNVRNEDIFVGDRHLPHITLSIGVAQAPDHGETADEVINAADTALYSAKNTGKDKVTEYALIQA